MKKLKKWSLRILGALAVLYFLLLIPDGNSKSKITAAAQKPFFWNRDHLWQSMEDNFMEAKEMPSLKLDSLVQVAKKNAEGKLSIFQNNTYAATDTSFATIENNFFNLATLIAARPGEVNWFIDYYNRVHLHIKKLSQQWNMQDTAVKNSLYTLLYGMRAALEEVLLQSDAKQISPAMLMQQEQSETPSTQIFGIDVHSGDLLVSRGGAEVSALISRGNDYPGNFSHVALIYIEAKSNIPYLIEAHIEKGVAVSTVEQYVKDKKLRFMVLRLRHDLPVMQKNMQLPQTAGALMYAETFKRHVPYDFKMNFNDSSEMFCSEVASYAYRKNGVQLWQNISTISSKGVVRWLEDFGVENFVTQMPSDLEYDPQLTVVAEWRDPETLFKDHIDNAVMDALLEKANAGATIGYNIWLLPIARMMKAYSWILNRFGTYSVIPEGMNATRALKNESFVAMHQSVKIKAEQMAEDFVKTNSYRPPYWQLVKFAELASAK